MDTTWTHWTADIRWNRITSSLTNFHIIVTFKTFRLLCHTAFFRCLSNSADYTERCQYNNKHEDTSPKSLNDKINFILHRFSFIPEKCRAYITYVDPLHLMCSFVPLKIPWHFKIWLTWIFIASFISKQKITMIVWLIDNSTKFILWLKFRKLHSIYVHIYISCVIVSKFFYTVLSITNNF